MAYTTIDFGSKAAVKRYLALTEPKGSTFTTEPATNASPVRCYQPGLGPDLSTFTGSITLEGPHAPKPHKWYAKATLVDGVVVSVR